MTVDIFSFKRSFPWVFLLSAAMILITGSSLLAEEARVLNLEQLIQMALETSPELKEAEQEIVAAESDLAQAKAGQWAQMDVIGMTGPAEDADLPTVIVDQDLGGGLLRGRLEDNDSDDIGIFGRLDLVIAQPLYTFGKISNRQQAARQGLEAQRIAKEKTRGDVVLKVKELYYAYIVSRQGQEAAADADGFVRDAKQRIQRLLKVGSKNVEETDLYRLEAFEAEVRSFKAKADSGARLSYVALKRAVGISPNQEFRVDVKELPRDTRTLGTQEEYMQRALDTRPELDQLKKGIEAKRALAEAAKADLYPSFFLAGIGSFAGAPGRERMPISYFDDDFNHAYMGVVLGSEWHFDLGIGAGKLKKARAEHQKLVHTKEFAEQNIPLEVAKNYQDVIEAHAAYTAYEKGAVAARKWIVSSFSNFDFGVGTAKDMFDAIDRYGKNQGEYLKALYEYNVSLARLSHSVAEYRSGNP